jgi:hypothetical protein
MYPSLPEDRRPSAAPVRNAASIGRPDRPIMSEATDAHLICASSRSFGGRLTGLTHSRTEERGHLDSCERFGTLPEAGFPLWCIRENARMV